MIRAQVAEEQNRTWHEAHICECVAFIERVKAENAKRLALAKQDLAGARDWALRESLTQAEVELIEAKALR